MCNTVTFHAYLVPAYETDKSYKVHNGTYLSKAFTNIELIEEFEVNSSDPSKSSIIVQLVNVIIPLRLAKLLTA